MHVVLGHCFTKLHLKKPRFSTDRQLSGSCYWCRCCCCCCWHASAAASERTGRGSESESVCTLLLLLLHEREGGGGEDKKTKKTSPPPPQDVDSVLPQPLSRKEAEKAKYTEGRKTNHGLHTVTRRTRGPWATRQFRCTLCFETTF
jgi:hypothetical protein